MDGKANLKSGSLSKSEKRFAEGVLLNVSVALFLVIGAIHLIIGLLALVFSDLELGQSILVVSTRTDTELFGAPPWLLIETNAELALFRSLVFNNVAGSLIVLGIFVSSLTWFGLRQREAWAYWTLTATGFLILPFWYLTFRPYMQAGVSIGFADLPPIFWIPAAALLPAVISGWLAIRGGSDWRIALNAEREHRRGS
jgi:hypothetical protein